MKYPCQLVNPLCPDDLCLLGYRHRGGHRLSTMGNNERFVLRRDHYLYMHVVKRGTLPLTEDALADEGWAAQSRLFANT